MIFVLVDGLGDEPARRHMGSLEHLVVERRATRFTSRASLPTNSRPNYETLHTGVAPVTHGVTSNLHRMRSGRPNTFSLAAAAGRRTAAVAYSWVSELYVRTPFDPATDMETSDPAGDIHEGRFYFTDEYPDEEVYARAATVVSRFQPDYLLVHPMGCDIAGHAGGAASARYGAAVERQDTILATAVPGWLGLGYTVVVGSDHGHRSEGGHGGTEPEVVNTPLYVIPPTREGRGDTGMVVDHPRIAPTIWGILGLGDTPRDAGRPIEL